MRGKYGFGAAALFAFTLAGLAACDRNPAAIAARDHDAAPADTGGYRTERASYTSRKGARRFHNWNISAPVLFKN